MDVSASISLKVARLDPKEGLVRHPKRLLVHNHIEGCREKDSGESSITLLAELIDMDSGQH
jgi:hypothetical protein